MRPSLIIVGPVATLAGDQGFGWAEAIAMAGGRVVAAETASAVLSLAATGTEIWRLGSDLVVMPGITDAHLHMASAAQQAQELDLSEAPDRVAALGAIAERHRLMAGGREREWLTGHGWSIDRFGGWPEASDLDGAAPGRLIALWSHDHHSRWVSEPALMAAGITSETPDPRGGLIRRNASGEPTGILHEHAASLVSAVIPRPTPETLATAIREYAAGLLRLGITGVQDPGEMAPDPELRVGPTLYRAMASAGQLPIRVAASIRPEQVRAAVERGFRSGETIGLYRGGWLKLFADGALGSRSAALLEPYEAELGGPPPVGGPRGMLLESVESLREMAVRAACAGICVQIHGIGDAAVRAALDVLSELPRVADGPMHRVEHAQLVDPVDIPRFAVSGIVASVQASHLASDAAQIRAAWGSRSRSAFPLRSILDAGGSLALGTDAPVESPNPWPGIAIAVTRTGAAWPAADGPFHLEQSITLAEALRAACVGPPQSAGETDRGRLAPGHLADLVVLSSEALTEPVTVSGAVANARPLATLIDGEIAYADPAFDPRS